ncbi:pentatricopeptide repeat-containing protein At1g71060, mitochondrial-like isoform X1 [Durio zibethinus]|uniref:Pentatricopeptide repeat-containing protein At1g71060, mitochondrial-like isoform X1 n=1 Tax=Durio zibethinus TaxID=66656 RepID=A0A6P5Y2P9_DURZI|nr:pentatricopeptide repeat-containing protein At1g71060, mitochondrial-like isoform X1 [Durio zibethinus]
MGLLRFLNLLSKTPRKRNLPVLCIRSLATHSQKSIKHQNFKLNSLPGHKTWFGYPPTLYRIIYRSIHEDLSPKKLSVEPYEKNPAEAKLEQDAAKICILLSNHSDSRVDELLEYASIEVSPSLVVEVLKRLSNAGVIAMSFFTWAEKQKGFKYNTESYNALIEALGKIKQFKLIWNLVNDMKSRKLLNKDTFALISRRYARARKVEEAIEAFERMEEYGFKLETSDFNRLIDTLSKSRNVEKANKVFDKMKRRRFVPDIKSYTILLEGWGKEHNLLRLNEVYREMKDEGFEPDVVTYGILISAYCRAKKYDAAIELFHEMETKNCKPSPHIFCTLINGLGSDKRLSEARQFFERSKSYGFAPEAPTYNSLVGAYCWSMQVNDAFRVVDEMRKNSVGPNSRTYDIILHHLIKARRTNDAYLVFQKMSSEPGCEPTVSTYEIIARMFCNEERVDMATQVWGQMKAKGVLPGMHMFSDLINSLCHENRLDDACKYFQEMLDAGIRPPANMFSNLKQALLDEGKKDTALDLARKIDKLRKIPLVVGGG